MELHSPPKTGNKDLNNWLERLCEEFASVFGIVSGTWEPEYEPETGVFTTMVMDVVCASYYKIGPFVFISCYIRTDNVDITGGSGNLRIKGLPYPVSGGGSYHTAPIGAASGWAGEHPITALFHSSYIFPRYRTAISGADAYTQVSDLTTGETADQNALIISGIYITS